MIILAHDPSVDVYIYYLLAMLAVVMLIGLWHWGRGLIRSRVSDLIIGGGVFVALFGWLLIDGNLYGMLVIAWMFFLPLGLTTSICAGWIPPGAKISKPTAASLGVLFLVLSLFSMAMH